MISAILIIKGNNMISKETKIGLIILETLHETGNEAIPSGYVYAAVMGEIDFDTYNHIIGALKYADLITEEYYLLRLTEKAINLLDRQKQERKRA